MTFSWLADERHWWEVESQGLRGSPTAPPGVPCDYSSRWARLALFSSLSPSAPRVVRAFPCWRSQVPQHPVCFPDHVHKISPLEPLPSRRLPGAWSSHLLPPLLRACPHVLPDTWVSLGRGWWVLSCAPQISLVGLQYSSPSGWGYLCSQLSPLSGISSAEDSALAQVSAAHTCSSRPMTGPRDKGCSL